jgi:aspartyl-tRNA(Asn)/glutamyl-tRNA(Gln) amidotransferase subunit B
MLIKSGDINGKQAKDILAKAYETKKSPSSLKEELGFTQITDENAIRDILNVIVENNPHMVAQYKERPERAEKFFIGMIMKETKGQANPSVANKVLKEKLS